MTSALVRQELGRPKLEAIAFAQALLDPDVARQLLEQLDPVRVSPALVQLLEQARDRELDDITIESKAQLGISNRAGELPLRELRGVESWSLKTLIALLNQLPPVRRIPSPAWQRDLETGLAAADADDGAGDVAGLSPVET